MNLLIDQDDQQKQQPPDEPQETPETEMPQYEEGEPPLLADTPRDVYRYDRSYVKKRSVVGPIVVIAVLLLIITVAAYFSFFYKPSEFAGYTPSEKSKFALQDSFAAQPPDEQVSQPADLSERVPVTAKPERTVAPAIARQGANPLSAAAKIISEILTPRPQDVTVGTVIIDDNSFSSEISSTSRSSIETYFAGLKAKLNGELSFSPSTGNYTGLRALITGSFASLHKEWQPGRQSIDIPQLQQTLQRKARESGLRVVELSSEKARTISGAEHTPIFVKLSGNEDQFNEFCAKTAEEFQNIAVSKIIIMFSARRAPTFVLRLEALKPL